MHFELKKYDLKRSFWQRVSEHSRNAQLGHILLNATLMKQIILRQADIIQINESFTEHHFE